MKKITPAILAILLVLTFGCSKSPSEMIVGKWEVEGKDQFFVEYFSDGTFSCDSGVGAAQINNYGSWIILEDDRLKLDFIFMGKKKSVVAKLSLDGEKMTTTTDEGEITKSIRIK